MSPGVGSLVRTRRAHARLVAGIDRCRDLAGDATRLAAHDPSVSGWSVGMHVAHLWRVDSGILGWIEAALDGDGSPPGGTPTATGRAVLVSGWIPRGRANAPEISLPEAADVEDLSERLSGLRGLAERIEPRLSEIHAIRATRDHPILGHFTPSQWLRFLEIHHRHHDKIVRDIG